MELTTYSFADLAGSINHPTFGSYLFDGTGVGSVTVAITSPNLKLFVLLAFVVKYAYISWYFATQTTRIVNTSIIDIIFAFFAIVLSSLLHLFFFINLCFFVFFII